MALAKEYEKQGIALILAPDDLCGLSTLTKTYEGLERMYRKGYAAAARIRRLPEQLTARPPDSADPACPRTPFHTENTQPYPPKRGRATPATGGVPASFSFQA